MSEQANKKQDAADETQDTVDPIKALEQRLGQLEQSFGRFRKEPEQAPATCGSSLPLLQGVDCVEARAMVAQLFKYNPEKAQDILARCCCENPKVYGEILSFISKPGASLHHLTGRGLHETKCCVASTSAVSNPQPRILPNRLRIAIKWGESRFALWLHPNAPGRNFFEGFQTQAEKRKWSWDQTRTSILLKESEEAPDEGSCELFLSEASLDATWSLTVNWLRNIKKEERLHIFGIVVSDNKHSLLSV